MAELTRRAFATIALAPILSSCQVAEERLDLSVTVVAEASFLEAIRLYARHQGLHIDSGDFSPVAYRAIELSDLTSIVIVDGAPHCGFSVFFRNKDDWTFFLPQRDKVQLKREFQRSITGLAGVEIADVSGARRACGVS